MKSHTSLPVDGLSHMPQKLRELYDTDPETREYIESREKLALLDPLFNDRIRNRRGFDIALNERFSVTLSDVLYRLGRSKRSPRLFDPHLSLLLFDLLGLKNINDTKGHLKGDELLHYVGNSMTQLTRPYDILARWGGDEFSIIMPETTYQSASMATRRIMHELLTRVPDEFRQFGVYGGLATFSTQTYQAGIRIPDDLVREADTRLYTARTYAKSDGRSCIIGENNEPVYSAPIPDYDPSFSR